MDFSRIDRRPVTVTITATNADSTPAVLDSVHVGLLPFSKKSPTATDQWLATDYEVLPPDANGVVRGRFDVLVAGPDANTAGALVLPPGGGRLWIKDPAADATQAVPAGRINLI